jgi:hypothetical protein
MYWNGKEFAANGNLLVVCIFGLSVLNVCNHRTFQTDELFLRHKFELDDSVVCHPRIYNVLSV